MPAYGKSAQRPADELGALRIRYPRFAISQEITGNRIRYIAHRQTAGHGLHTLITADLSELAEALGQAHPSQTPPPPAG